jgi:hypothetical protein
MLLSLWEAMLTTGILCFFAISQFLCDLVICQRLLCVSLDTILSYCCMQPICDASIESLICLVSHLLLIYHTGVSYRAEYADSYYTSSPGCCGDRYIV